MNNLQDTRQTFRECAIISIIERHLKSINSLCNPRIQQCNHYVIRDQLNQPYSFSKTLCWLRIWTEEDMASLKYLNWRIQRFYILLICYTYHVKCFNTAVFHPWRSYLAIIWFHNLISLKFLKSRNFICHKPL